MSHFAMLRLLALLLGLAFVGAPALAADIETFDQARDRLLAQDARLARDGAALYGDPDQRPGEIALVLDARTVRLGQGPGWLFGAVLPDGGKRVAFVAADGTTRFAPTNELPAGLAAVAVPAGPADAAPVTSLEAATTALTDRLLGHSLQGRRVYAAATPVADSVTIDLWRTSVTLSGGPGWLFFIDDVPAANWEHACRFALVAESGEIHVATARTPPKDMAGFTELTTWPRAKAVTQPLPAARSGSVAPAVPYAGTDASHRYAVILSGGYNKSNNHVRYWNDCSKFFITLKANGFLQENIFVLFADGTDPAIDNSNNENSNVDLNNDAVPDIGYSATKANIATVFNELAGKLGSQDILYIFTTDHGGNGSDNPSPYNTSSVVLNLWGEDITNTEFAAEVNKVTAKAVVAIFEQCFSGGMIEPLKSPNRVLMSAARFWELSYAMGPDYTYDEFSFYVTEALADTAKGDSNADGIVTMEEAYAYALGKDSRQQETLDGSGDNIGEHPSYYSNPWNLGRQLGLGGHYPSAKAPTYGGYAQYQTVDAFPTNATGQGWKGTDQHWSLSLPFAFPLGGQTYATASVSSHGIVYFANPTTSGYNSVDGLAGSVAVAPLWDRLTTAGAGNDIAVDSSASGVTIVWKAATVADGRPVNVAVRLYPSGAMRFYYGPGNQHTSRIEQRDKTIGVSAGSAATMLLGLRNGLPDLGGASALLVQPSTLPPPAAGLPWEMLLLSPE
ncbi:C13 family peptidase [Solidesulfovibrio sp.]